ncbi:MAG: hypothetical protein ACJ8FY_00450 [Gemmataceae bacterium]
MITCAILMAGLLGATDLQPTGALRGPKAREEFVITFTWVPIEKWQVEIREYQFHRGLPPGLLAEASKVEIIEVQFHPDLAAVFKKIKNQER